MLTGPGATLGKARQLRRAMSLPEVLLWQQLRQRPGGFKFRRQHPAGPFILDFACLQSKLAVEIDGEAHGRGAAPLHDEIRDEWLTNQGFRTLQVPAQDVLKNLEGVLSLVVERCAAEQPLHHEQVRSAPHCAAMSGRHGDLLISHGPPPRTGEDL